MAKSFPPMPAAQTDRLISHQKVARKLRSLMPGDANHQHVRAMAHDRILWLAQRETELLGQLSTYAGLEVELASLRAQLAEKSIDAETAQYKRMFEATCVALGAINEALGLDPEDGGAEPILDAIAELKSSPPIEVERKAAEHEYSISAHDYVSNPVGSRDWTLYWAGWLARSTADLGRADVQDATMGKTFTEACKAVGDVADRLIATADYFNMVVTVERRARQPLAMGNADYVVQMRGKRGYY